MNNDAMTNQAIGSTLGAGANAQQGSTKRSTLRQDLESNIKRAVDTAAKCQKALMTLPVEILDADADKLSEAGVYVNCYPY